MEITQEQYERIEGYLPRQRGNVSMGNLDLINAILYVTENGCKWRALPRSYGRWHTTCVRMSRWSKNGVSRRVFEAPQAEGAVQVRVEAVCLDSTSAEAYPNGTGAPKKGGSPSDARGAGSPRRPIWLPQPADRLSSSPSRSQVLPLEGRGPRRAEGDRAARRDREVLPEVRVLPKGVHPLRQARRAVLRPHLLRYDGGCNSVNRL